MEIYFQPDKKWWQFWKKGRYLNEGEDFILEHSCMKLCKPLKGKFSFSYGHRHIPTSK